MDEGPERSTNEKDLKPAPKNPNSADHEEEYEARAQASQPVDMRTWAAIFAITFLIHNTAYPKLNDELDQRRSMVQKNPNSADHEEEYEARADEVHKIAPNKTHNANPKCVACDKPKCCKPKPRRRSRSRKRTYKRTKKTIQKTRRKGDAYTKNIVIHFKNQFRIGRSNAFRSRGVEINENHSETDSD